jgi:hypothetical protein
MDSRFRGNDNDYVFRKPLCWEYNDHTAPRPLFRELLYSTVTSLPVFASYHLNTD